MGEYAIRKSDGAEIKIGTCENMYYLRFEDRHAVEPLADNTDPATDAGELRFRIPYPDEDGIQPGDYDNYNRGLRLYRERTDGRYTYCAEFADPSTCDDPGIMQLHHQASGLLLNVPCYHGHKLPEVAAPMSAFWNGKGHSLELSQLRPDAMLNVRPVVRCRHCSHAWRYEWADIWEYISDDELKARLAVYAPELAEEEKI